MQAWRPLFSYCISLFLRTETSKLFSRCLPKDRIWKQVFSITRFPSIRWFLADVHFYKRYWHFIFSAPSVSCLWGLSAPNTPASPEQPTPPWLLVPGLLHGARAPSPVWGGWAEGRAGGCSPRCRAAPAEQPGRMAGGNCSGRDWWLQ